MIESYNDAHCPFSYFSFFFSSLFFFSLQSKPLNTPPLSPNMKDQQLFERPLSQCHNFNHIHDHGPDNLHSVNHRKVWDKTIIYVNPKGRDGDDNALGSMDSSVRPFQLNLGSAKP